MYNEETLQSWQSRDFILDEIDRIEEQSDRLAALYDYLMIVDTFDVDLEEEM